MPLAYAPGSTTPTHRRTSDRTPALVFGTGLTALGVIRCLGRRGIPTFVATDGVELIQRSRWLRRLPNPAGHVLRAEELTRFLEALPFDRAVLFPCSDDWATAIAGLDKRLRTRFPSFLPEPNVLAEYLDKGAFAGLLDRTGVPHPRTHVLDGPDDVMALPEEGFERFFLKPRDSQQFFKLFGVKAFWITSREEAAARATELQRLGCAVILQEYVPGPADNHYFIDGYIDADGNLATVFARRRLRMYPTDFGNSTFMRSVSTDETAGAIDTIRRLVSLTGYRGIFSAEFKRDERDNQFKILELNVRPWWYVEFAAQCGVDVCQHAYEGALGGVVAKPDTYRAGRACIYPYFDRSACLELRKHKQMSPGAWIWSWVTSRQPVFQFSDPLPALVEAMRILRRQSPRLLRRLVRLLPHKRSRPSTALVRTSKMSSSPL